MDVWNGMVWSGLVCRSVGRYVCMGECYAMSCDVILCMSSEPPSGQIQLLAQNKLSLYLKND